MVPSISLTISFCHSERRSIPATAIFVSLATPERSAQPDRATPTDASVCISRRIGRQRWNGELRRDIAAEYRRADMIEAALDIGPDLAADIGPASTKRKILAEIGSARWIDHAFEQGK